MYTIPLYSLDIANKGAVLLCVTQPFIAILHKQNDNFLAMFNSVSTDSFPPISGMGYGAVLIAATPELQLNGKVDLICMLYSKFVVLRGCHIFTVK